MSNWYIIATYCSLISTGSSWILCGGSSVSEASSVSLNENKLVNFQFKHDLHFTMTNDILNEIKIRVSQQIDIELKSSCIK